ncbi:hypothetical protein HUS23_13775 [Ectothiorhodospiraceae bacterium 2226]|nr:hypothetical protein HUS23_13775 [Ectothiorhodospiraceae bacterium 2226]
MEDPRLDPVSVADFLLNGTVCYPFTLFSGVYAAPPGAVTDVTPDDIQSEVYYRPDEGEDGAPLQMWGMRLREQVQKVLLVGLEGKRNIKVLFSGGEDSRAVVSLLPPDVECELVTFSDGYNREVKLAERAARALGRPLRFVRRPEGFYRQDIRARARLIGGVSDVRHTHVYGVLADSLGDADAIVGGFMSDSLFKSMLVANASRTLRRIGPETLTSDFSTTPVGIADAKQARWLDPEVASCVVERRNRHQDLLAEFRPRSAVNWHWLWPVGCHHEQFAHYLAVQNLGRTVVEPFLSPQVYALAASMPDEVRVDRKVFRAAFGSPMGRAGWLPTSSGRIPRLGGYAGHYVELGTVVYRRAGDRAANLAARIVGRKPINQGAWSGDYGAFRNGLAGELSGNQFERARELVNAILTAKEANAFFKPGGGDAPDLARNRLLQVAYLMDE